MGSQVMSYLAPTHQSRQELLIWINTLELDYQKAIDDCDQLLNGEVLCLIVHELFPAELRVRQVVRNATLNYDRKKNFKTLKKVCAKNKIAEYVNFEEIVEQNNIFQLVELVRAIHAFYMSNFFMLQQNREERRVKEAKEEARQKLKKAESENREQVIKKLADERDVYYTKLRQIEEEIKALVEFNRRRLKPIDKQEKLVLDRIQSILSTEDLKLNEIKLT